MQKKIKGDTPKSEYLPFDLSFLELSAFQVALHHSPVQLLPKFIEKIGAAVVLAAFHVHIDVAAVLDFHTEDFGKDVCQLLYADLSIVNAVAGVEGVKEFYQIDDFTRPIS